DKGNDTKGSTTRKCYDLIAQCFWACYNSGIQ
ncbi:MAG: hypothetical protein JWN47_3150, partial [Frankiales bacterium]|nr:hypothetical protein [Frankiales bacterium]